jgi:hypothetical protein
VPTVSPLSYPHLYECFKIVCEDLGGKPQSHYEAPEPPWYAPLMFMMNREARTLYNQAAHWSGAKNDLLSLLTANIVTRRTIAKRSVMLTNLNSFVDAFIIEDWGMATGGFGYKASKVSSKGPNMQQVPKKTPLVKPLMLPGGVALPFESSLSKFMSTEGALSLGQILNEALNSSAVLKTASMSALAVALKPKPDIPNALVAVQKKLIGQIKNKPAPAHPCSVDEWELIIMKHNVEKEDSLHVHNWGMFLNDLAHGIVPKQAYKPSDYGEGRQYLLVMASEVAKAQGHG